MTLIGPQRWPARIVSAGIPTPDRVNLLSSNY